MINGWFLPWSKSEKSVASLEKLLKTLGKVMVEINCVVQQHIQNNPDVDEYEAFICFSFEAFFIDYWYLFCT